MCLHNNPWQRKKIKIRSCVSWKICCVEEEEEEVGELQIPLVYCKPRMRIQREEQRDPGRKEDAVVVVVVVVMVVVMHILLCPLLQTWFSQAVLGVSSSSYRKTKKKNGWWKNGNAVMEEEDDDDEDCDVSATLTMVIILSCTWFFSHPWVCCSRSPWQQIPISSNIWSRKKK